MEDNYALNLIKIIYFYKNHDMIDALSFLYFKKIEHLTQFSICLYFQYKIEMLLKIFKKYNQIYLYIISISCYVVIAYIKFCIIDICTDIFIKNL